MFTSLKDALYSEYIFHVSLTVCFDYSLEKFAIFVATISLSLPVLMPSFSLE